MQGLERLQRILELNVVLRLLLTSSPAIKVAPIMIGADQQEVAELLGLGKKAGRRTMRTQS